MSETIKEEVKKPKIKYALVVDKPEKPLLLTVPQLLRLKPRLVDRAICEFDDSTLQIIPFITLVFEESQQPPKYFVYMRGDLGGEPRLFGQCSIGLGGHMEQDLRKEYEGSKLAIEFAHLIADGAVQEIQEEIGVEFPYTDFVNLLLDEDHYMPISDKESIFAFKNTALIYAPVTEVDKKHIGITFIVKLDPKEITKLEEGIITKAQWLTEKQIREYQSLAVNPLVLETWSELQLGRIHQMYLNCNKAIAFEGKEVFML